MQNHHRRKFVINMAAHFATLTLLLISLSFPGIEEVTNFRSKNVVGFHFLKKKNLMLPWPMWLSWLGFVLQSERSPV